MIYSQLMARPRNINNQPAGPKAFLGLKYAGTGIIHFFKTQQNARIQASIGGLVILLGLLLGISTTEWLIVVLCIVTVLAAEMLNTAIEHLVDFVSPEFDSRAGRIKDIAAGAVLVAAIGAAVAGSWIFIPRLVELIAGIWTGTG